MLIAQQKEKENIAEYILYMYQVEDMIRSCDLNIEKIETSIITQLTKDYETKLRVKSWYADLIKKMKKQNIQQKGHLQQINAIINELKSLHEQLLNVYQDKEYLILHQAAFGNLTELRIRSGSIVMSDVETCFNGLYGLLLLKVQKKKVSKETILAMKSFSELLAHLSARYKQHKEVGLDLESSKKN